MHSLIASLLLGHEQVMLHLAGIFGVLLTSLYLKQTDDECAHKYCEQVSNYGIPVSDETLKLQPVN